jgi:Tol biopolymer transport system component
VTRRPGAVRGTQDPYGLGPARGYVAPIVAGIALIVIAAMTFTLLNGQMPFRNNSSGNGNPGPNRTAAPSNVVIVEPQVTFPGSMVYAKAGNIWVQTGKDVHQVTNSGLDSMPSFSPDGAWIYFIRQVPGRGLFPVNGRLNWYDLATPALVRVKSDGSAEPEGIASGRVKKGKSLFFFWMREPVLSPDGHTIAVVSDGTDPTANDVVAQFYDTKTKKFTKLKLATTSGLGHQDPAWMRDGSYLLLVKNGRDGSRGAPQIIKYNPVNQKVFTITGPGYLSPSPSPDNRYIAATRTDSFGTDIVILDGTTGAELVRVTSDGSSFSPVWSPAGEAIAFLRLNGTIVDLQMAKLAGQAGSWTVGETIALTEVSGLDAGSRPGWFIPASELPKPSQSTVPSGSAPGSSAPASAAP